MIKASCEYVTCVIFKANDLKNFILYTLLSSFAIGSFAIIDTLFLLNKGVDWQYIAILSSVLNVGVLLSELPTGIISDKIGVFKAICIGTLFRSLACFCYVVEFAHHLIVASILASIGIAFLSGTINSATIKLKTLANTNTETAFANIRYYKSIATLLGGFCGFYLFGIHNHYAWILAGIGLLLSVIFLIPLIKRFNFIEKHEFSLQYLKEVSFNSLKTPIFWACVLFSVSAVAPMISWQVLFNQFDKGLLLGFLLLNTASIFSSLLLKKFSLSNAYKYAIIIANIISLIAIPLLKENVVLLTLLMFFHIFCHSATSIFIFAKFHDSIDDKARNSLESLSSALDSILVVPIYLLTAYFLDNNSMIGAFLLSSLLCFMVFALYFIANIHSKYLKKH